jgi:hypothetical protein
MSDKKQKLSKPLQMRSQRKKLKTFRDTQSYSGITPSQKKGPQSLSESVNRKSNLSSMLNSRQNINESKQSADPLWKRCKNLQALKNNFKEKNYVYRTKIDRRDGQPQHATRRCCSFKKWSQTGLLEGLNDSQKAKHGSSFGKPSSRIVA